MQSTADALFVPWVVGSVLGPGLFLTFRTGVVQVRRFGEAGRVRSAGGAGAADGALTPFQAFMTAIAATIGTGNIAGVATAIVSGGPGALFWIWVYGFIAMAIKFTEASLGVHFRDRARRADAGRTDGTTSATAWVRRCSRGCSPCWRALRACSPRRSRSRTRWPTPSRAR